jgi:hypothetical protein
MTMHAEVPTKEIHILMNAAYQEGIEKPGDVLLALERVDNWLRAMGDTAGWGPAPASREGPEAFKAGAR